jgi:hypothetical protein
VPSLPRIKRQRPRPPAREVAARPEPRLAEQSAHGLTWIHLDAPTTEEATELADRMKKVTYTAVRREHNELADRLVNEALDAEGP